MANLLANKKKLFTIIVGVLIVGFLIYTIVPSNLPKPIYIEFVSAESDVATTETETKAEPTTQEPAWSDPAKESAPVVNPQYPQVGQGIMYDAGSRVVNLLDPVGRRYLKIDIVLEFLPPDHKYYQLEEEERSAARESFLAEVADRKPIVEDILISLLTSRSYEDIYTLEGKNLLRADVQEHMNEILREPRVVAVYFTEFLIQ